MKTIYLDYNATTPVLPSICEAMLPFLQQHHGNPSSHHALGRACHEAVEDARSHVAALLGADSEEIVFTSGGTESNNLALKGILLHESARGRGHMVISAIEHPAITQPARFLQRMGCELSVVPCNAQGVVEPSAVKAALRPDTMLVSVMHANNETGTIQPIREIAQLCRTRNILMHTDAAQSTGKIATLVESLGVDLLSIAGHKLYAPKGIGALYVRRGTALEPLMHGAGHERGLRAGTENVPCIVGLGRAAVLAARGLDEMGSRMSAQRDQLHETIHWAMGEELTVNGFPAERLPNTLSVNIPGVSGHALLGQIPELCASTGAACHSGGNISATLAAMGLSPQVAEGTVRLSVGWNTSQEDIDRAAELLIAAWENVRGR